MVPDEFFDTIPSQALVLLFPHLAAKQERAELRVAALLNRCCPCSTTPPR